MDHGKIVYDGNVERIKAEYGRYRTLVVHFSEPVAEPQLDGAELDGRDKQIARFKFDRNTQRVDRLVRQASERYGVEDVSIEEPDLESIIKHIYVRGYEENAS
jgi:ABC-2 type transport system ATP-binding protein